MFQVKIHNYEFSLISLAPKHTMCENLLICTMLKLSYIVFVMSYSFSAKSTGFISQLFPVFLRAPEFEAT